MSTESKSRMAKEEKEVMKEYMKGASLVAYAGFAYLGVIVYLLLNNRMPDLSGGVKATDLTNFSSKAEFVFRLQAVNVAWLLFSMFYVVSKRVRSGAVNPMAGYEDKVLLASKHFNNTLEQFVMSLTSQLVLITFLDSVTILKIIPTLNLLFIVGRVFFWLGYPKYRAFGFITNNIPITATISYCVYRFVLIYYKK